MKKITFFLMAMLVSLTSFAAALGEGYSKVTDITTLSAGDKVVLYCDDADKGVTGWDGNKTATAAAEGWVEYVVEAAEGGVLLKDGEQYIALTAKNGFYYTATGSVCKVTADGVLYITLSGADYLLYENANNGSPLYRMYVDKTGNAQYKPVYVYEVVVAEEGGEGEGEGETATVPTNEELWEAFKPYYKTFYSEERADQPITMVATFMTQGEKIFTDATSEYKWLGDYLVKIATEQGYTINSEALWRWHADAFFQANQHTAWPKSADFTEAGKPENWGPYYLAAQEGTTPEPEPTTETVYFVNNKGWENVNVYAWEPANAGWPGVAATKEAEQIGGYDVYSYTAEAGAYANVIFNNGSGDQTTDLVWTAGKYVVNNQWYTKEEAEAQLAKPVEYESVYFVDNQSWGKANIYTWTPEVGTWPGVAMTKEAEQLAGYDVYSYTVEKGTSFGGVIFNNGSGVQTGNLVWTAGKYYVKDGWYTKEEAEAKLAGPVTPPVITYVLMGVAGDWTTGIAMTQNPDNANEYVLLGQEILEGDAVKVVTLTDGTATAWCGNVDEYSVEHSADDMGNIVLAPGKYDFYYKVAEDLIYIGGEAYKPEIEWLEMPLEITNLTTEVMEVEGAKYLQLMGRDDMNDADVTLFLNNYADVDDDYEVNAESSYMTFGGMELTVLEGVMTQTSETDKGTVYNGIVRTYVAEDSLYVAFNLTMYAAPATVLELTDAIVAINEDLGTLTFNVPTGEGEGYFVELSGYTAPGVHEGPQICLFETPEVVAYTNYAETSVADGVITLKGEFTSFMGAKFDLTISGKLPVVEEPEPAPLKGIVKRALTVGESTVVLTLEADGTAHIYNIKGENIAEVSLEGVVAVDTANLGDLLAISDIAVTEDGKLLATNYMITQSDDTRVDAGYKRGETRIYIWNDLAGDPSILFTSKMSSNWFRSKQGLTMAVKGTSDNMEIFMTGIHATSAWARVSSYRVIDGVYVEPEVNHNDHYYFYDVNDAIALETTVGTQYELNASPLGEMNWVLDAELINPTEIVEPETNNVEITTSVALTEDLGKKYNGASYVTVGEAVLMVAPFANPDGELVGAEILNITNGFDAPVYVDMVYVDEAVAATAAATAVEVVEGGLNITLVADNAIHTWFVELSTTPEYQVYEDEITNLVIDLDNLVLIGGPSSAFQVDVFLGLGEYNRNDDTYQLLPESSIAVMGSDATFIDGYAYEVDAFTPSAKAVVHCEWNGMLLEFHLTMTAAPMEATKVVVENAAIEIEKYVIFGDMYDYSLKMSGEWVNEADGLTYPVLVEVPVYYPEATEPSEIMSTVTVGGMGDNDPWLGFGEGTLTVTTVDNVITATGIVQNPMAGVAIDITISGTITSTGVENATVTVKPVKMIQNGQLIIKKGDVQYNAQGAILK